MIKLNFLRIIFLVQFLAAGIAILNGHGYLDWQQASAQEIMNSRDAFHSIKSLLSDWWFFKGVCGGITVCMALIAMVCRREIVDGGWNIKVHWIAQALPISTVLAYGHNI